MIRSSRVSSGRGIRRGCRTTKVRAKMEIDFSEKWKLLHGDAREMLLTLPSDSVDCCITSPPYYALRDYGYDGQIGLESTPEEFIEKLVSVFREVRRVLKPSGTCWINIADSYWGSGSRGFDFTKLFTENPTIQSKSRGTYDNTNMPQLNGHVGVYKGKDLIGIPWMLAFSLRADGWYLRQDIIWAKPNPMPESVTDRCTKSHEYIFLLSKSPKYFYDYEAIKTDANPAYASRYKYAFFGSEEKHGAGRPNGAINTEGLKVSDGKANKRSVWFVSASAGYTDHDGAHYATYNPELIEPCVLAGCPAGGVVIDPFNGTGTTGVVALKHGRKYIGIDMSKDYIDMSRRRLEQETAQYSIFDMDEREEKEIDCDV